MALFRVLINILIQILKETPDNHDEQDSDWEGCDDGYTLETIEGVLCKEKTDWKEDEQECPESTDFA